MVNAEIPLINVVNTLADLRTYQPMANVYLLLVGKSTVKDGLGGFYRWDAGNTADEDTKFLNTLTSSVDTTGRWVRIFQKASVMPQGYMVNQGGVKNFYIPGTTNASGQVVAYLTADGTATGTPLFAEVWETTAQQNPTTTSASSPIIGYSTVSTDLKTITSTFYKNHQQTLGTTLTSIIGLNISGLTTLPAGVSVIVKVEGT